MPQSIKLTFSWNENVSARVLYVFHNNKSKEPGQVGTQQIEVTYSAATSPIHFVAAGLEFIGSKLTGLEAKMSIDGGPAVTIAANAEGATHFWKVAGAP